MAADQIPVKTPEGHAELGTRRLRLSQRHRTVLLLVDGHRTESQVRELARKAGVADACYDELMGLSLIAVPDVPSPPAPAGVATPVAVASPVAVVSEPIPLVVVQDSLLPASRTLPPDSSRLDSVSSGPQPPESWLPEEEEEEVLSAPVDPTLEQAREILLRLVRTEAPVAGSLTLLRLRRARTREDLAQLLDEVESRVSKRRSLAVTQSLTSARQLLGPGLDSARSAA